MVVVEETRLRKRVMVVAPLKSEDVVVVVLIRIEGGETLAHGTAAVSEAAAAAVVPAGPRMSRTASVRRGRPGTISPLTRI